ncbi:MAG TPA: STAS domain-containing protein [Anaerolineales bacterium]|nr:STAS domain-containing protein [Anaerolineales bacterium]HMV96261.1 STAS domain-containing protein [Anaerolineales bacterium]HMX20946.1 STAS domain-containing protein [Anaerolineales bacterium]HMX75910.1 STAS domain-containing protein [Anaerolineales bacterium]HMZ44600.1 STAS domain-containing protein [Anaerolineales bacterium]
MKLQSSDLENGIRLIKLVGKLDSNGTYAIEIEFIKSCAGEKPRILVDLSKVNYISSIGIPMLVNTARSVMARGGKLGLLNPQRNVLDVLELVGVSMMLPIYYDLKTATAGMLA